MRLKSLHPGVTVEQVKDNTGFDVVVSENVPTTPMPSTEHLALLRTRIDAGGELRR
jgi:glutaconate CoA-transferase subunit B